MGYRREQHETPKPLIGLVLLFNPPEQRDSYSTEELFQAALIELHKAYEQLPRPPQTPSPQRGNICYPNDDNAPPPERSVFGTPFSELMKKLNEQEGENTVE